MIQREAKGGLDQVVNNYTNPEQDDYKNKILEGIKQNLILSMLSFLWCKLDENSNSLENGSEFQKLFLENWKENIINVSQEQLKEINKALNDNNIDMLNIITGEKQITDIEDYQEILNKSIAEVESIYWKICGKQDND